VRVSGQVGRGQVGGGAFLDVARVAPDPLDGGVVALLLEQQSALLGDGVEGVVVHLRAGQHRDLGVEQIDELAEDSALGLPAEPQEDEVVPRENGVDERRHHGVLVPDDAGQDRLPRPEALDQVLAQLLLDRARTISGSTELTDSGGTHQRIGSGYDRVRARIVSDEVVPQSLSLRAAANRFQGQDRRSAVRLQTRAARGDRPATNARFHAVAARLSCWFRRYGRTGGNALKFKKISVFRPGTTPVREGTTVAAIVLCTCSGTRRPGQKEWRRCTRRPVKVAGSRL